MKGNEMPVEMDAYKMMDETKRLRYAQTEEEIRDVLVTIKRRMEVHAYMWSIGREGYDVNNLLSLKASLKKILETFIV